MSEHAARLHRRRFLKTAVRAGALMIAPQVISGAALGKDGAVAPSERAQKNFRDPVRDAFISLDGEGDNYVVCAFLNDRPFKDRRGLKEAVETLAAEYRDEHPDRKPLPLGMIRVLSRGEVTTVSNDTTQPADDHNSNFGLLGEIRNHFGPSYSVVGFELPLPADRSNPLIPDNPETPPARPVPDPA